MAISAAVLVLSIVSMSEFSDQIFAQNGGVFEYVKKRHFLIMKMKRNKIKCKLSR